ncbi:MAG: porphobilinogen synthase [Thermoplasmatales archaeon]|nr:porphobilinogen synthase [Candidatus Thermoplasmatota archaeon]MCL6003396.1 porphobilinogen synthase [Candidatus Thermoplasmatota archaeon]MDA8056090.1 porphobilinogen synthase [Thermoplasmatales archaeon]
MRLRRLRKSPRIREVFSDTEIRANKLIMPLFVDENISRPEEIKNMPDVFRLPLGGLVDKVKEYEDIGVKSVLLFGVPNHKDATGSTSYEKNGIVQRAVREIKRETDLAVFTDLCLCEYTDHGHCGILNGRNVDNDSTLETYAKIAKSYAEAGVDGVAPSGMMDGQVGRIRKELDSTGFEETLILAYSAKFSSSMYAPFREAVFSTPSFGDRRTYQMPYSNTREAIREIELDVEEGADVVMVKPALFYLDIIKEARNRFLLPIAAYNVSAEYSLIKSAAEKGIIDLDSVVDESLSSIFRAGADIVISYFTEYILKRTKN